MAVSKLKLEVNQGATFRMRLTWKTGAPPLPVDLTGYTARMDIREDIDDITPRITLNTENGGLTLGGVTGTIDLYISSSATTLFDWESGVYDIEMIAPGAGGDVRRLIGGAVVVSPEVTRS